MISMQIDAVVESGQLRSCPSSIVSCWHASSYQRSVKAFRCRKPEENVDATCLCKCLSGFRAPSILVDLYSPDLQCLESGLSTCSP